MEYRTKPTVEAGMVTQRVADGPTRMIEYQPGNGTRYLVMFTDLSLEQAKLLGASANSVLVTLLGPAFGSYPLQRGGFLARSYFDEKFGVKSESDAMVLCELLATVLGRQTDATPAAAGEVEE